MNPEFRNSRNDHRQQVQDPFGYSLWVAEIATMDHAATNLAYVVDRVISKIIAAFDWVGDRIDSLRTACPIEVESVKIARPAQADQASPSADRAAA